MRAWLAGIAFVAAGCSVIVDNRLEDVAPAPQCRVTADCECTKGDCIGGRCTGLPEDDGKSCNLPNGSGSTCVSGGCTCSSDAQCDDGNDCSGEERCHRELQVCVLGEALAEGERCGTFDVVRVCRRNECVLP